MPEQSELEKANLDKKETFYCSFCGKSQHEVKKLIRGPTSLICDECVELCVEKLIEEGVKDPNQELEKLKRLERVVHSELLPALARILKSETERHAPFAELQEAIGKFEAK